MRRPWFSTRLDIDLRERRKMKMTASKTSPYPSDFQGYGGHPPDPQWPAGARVAVSLVVNVEAGSELSVADGDARNESIYEIVELVEKVPNYCLASHFDWCALLGLPAWPDRNAGGTRG